MSGFFKISLCKGFFLWCKVRMWTEYIYSVWIHTCIQETVYIWCMVNTAKYREKTTCRQKTLPWGRGGCILLAPRCCSPGGQSLFTWGKRFLTFGRTLIFHRLVIKAFQVTADHSFNSPEESRIKTTVVFEKKIFGRIFIKTFLFVKMITILARGCRDCQTGSDERRGDKPSNSTVNFFHQESMNTSKVQQV